MNCSPFVNSSMCSVFCRDTRNRLCRETILHVSQRAFEMQWPNDHFRVTKSWPVLLTSNSSSVSWIVDHCEHLVCSCVHNAYEQLVTSLAARCFMAIASLLRRERIVWWKTRSTSCWTSFEVVRWCSHCYENRKLKCIFFWIGQSCFDVIRGLKWSSISS
jgi:hypothetical protein